MIRYALKCAEAHNFESWFASAEAFDTLLKADMVACPLCGDTKVTKAIMAPRVATARKKASEPTAPKREKADLKAPMSDAEKAFAKVRKHVEDKSDYVGLSFASEARAMHDGDIPTRAIYGEAKPEEAKKLIEEGVPVAPLPFIPQRKTN